VAEELIFQDVATGAQNDLERATEIARGMVMEFGMSRLGRVNFRERGRAMFLPGAEDFGQRNHSEQTAREIDLEIKRIIEESLEKVRHLLETRKKALIALAERLVVKETIDTAELREVVEANSPGVAIVPGTADAAGRRTVEERPASTGDNNKAADGT
jgi:cell division protease FtsH